MKFTDTCKVFMERSEISLSHQMDFETYLRNHAKEIINLVEAAEAVLGCYISDAVIEDEAV